MTATGVGPLPRTASDVSAAREYIGNQVLGGRPISIATVMALGQLSDIAASRLIRTVQDEVKPPKNNKLRHDSNWRPKSCEEIASPGTSPVVSVAVAKLPAKNGANGRRERGPLITDEMFRAAVEDGQTVSQMVGLFGLSKSTVYIRLKAIGCPGGRKPESPAPTTLPSQGGPRHRQSGTDYRRPSLRKIDDAEILSGLAEGLSSREIARRFQMHPGTLYTRVKRLREQGRLPKRDPNARSQRHPTSAPPRSAPPAIKSFVFYDGPSMLDGAPILGIVSGLGWSENRKSGDMLHTWIVRRDYEPHQATAAGADASVCGSCRFREARRDGGPRCYVLNSKTWPALINLFRSWKLGNVPTLGLEAAATLIAGRKLRLGSYGDPAAIPLAAWHALIAQTAGTIGFTHQWANPEVDPAFARLCMASVDSPVQRDEAHALGYRTYRTTAEPLKLAGEGHCPASAEMGHATTCEQCMLCGGTGTGRKVDIVILHHGGAKKRGTP